MCAFPKIIFALEERGEPSWRGHPAREFGFGFRRAGRPDRIGTQKPRKAGRFCAGFMTRFEIQIRERPVRLPTDPTVADRAIEALLV